MKLPAILTSDPHFTASPRDEYRWGLWPWLADQSRIEGVKTVVICGDLTDAKDYHPASLTNRLVAAIAKLREQVDEIIIDLGNHDYLREGHAYFAFLNNIPGVTFITKPTEFMLDTGPTSLFLPHTKTPAQTWAGMDFSHYDYLFMHQTIKGSLSSNGTEMEGEELPDLRAAGKVWSGDIHVPQVIGPVEYIGSPYHVHFGDAFRPRCVLLDRRNRPVDLHFETISRLSLKIAGVDDLRRLKMRAGDQVQVKLVLAESEAHEWAARRRAVSDYLRRAEVQLHGIKLEVERSQTRRRMPGQALGPGLPQKRPEDVVIDFVRANDLGVEAVHAGLGVLE